MAVEQFRLKVRLQLESDLHTAGPGRTLPLVDRSVEVDAHNRPYLPASSVRGRVRAHLERVLTALGEPVCTPPRPDRTCPHHRSVAEELGRRGAPEPFCMACRLFGSVWRLSPITFSDFMFTAPQTEQMPLSPRPGVGISRHLGTTEEERLYVLETVPSQRAGRPVMFEGTIEGQLEQQEIGWLLAALRTVTHIGGGKARGLGRVTPEIIGLDLWDEAKKQWVLGDWMVLLKGVLGDGTAESHR